MVLTSTKSDPHLWDFRLVSYLGRPLIEVKEHERYESRDEVTSERDVHEKLPALLKKTKQVRQTRFDNLPATSKVFWDLKAIKIDPSQMLSEN